MQLLTRIAPSNYEQNIDDNNIHNDPNIDNDTRLILSDPFLSQNIDNLSTSQYTIYKYLKYKNLLNNEYFIDILFTKRQFSHCQYSVIECFNDFTSNHINDEDVTSLFREFNNKIIVKYKRLSNILLNFGVYADILNIIHEYMTPLSISCNFCK